MNIPVFDGDRIVAVAGVGNKEEDYNESDVRQLTLLMDGMWRIIQRRRAAEALRERNETLRAIIQGSPVAIITLDQAANVTSWSAVAERILGWSAAEVIGGPSPIIPPEKQEEARHLRERMLQGESITDLEVRRQKKDGSPIDLSLSTAPMRDKEGNLSGYVYLLIDITQHKKMEEELFRARKIESIGLLAGGIAHDFNNLLSVILGNISMARTRLASDDMLRIFEKLAEAEKACLRSRELTYQLLTFSRGGAPVKKTASIAELLKESAGFALRGSDVRCEFSLPDDLWPAEMDEGQIGQVISNLVINADQAMPKGGVVQVRAENVVVGARLSLPLPQGRYVKVTVEDHGIGIPKEHLQGIFDPYFTTKQKGSGLGLATAYSIIRRHDGYIALVSELGTGTKAMFYLPASQKKAPPKKDSMEAPIAGRGRILVMDDEEMIRDLVEAMLTQLGYEVTPAKDGAEAIESYAKARQSGAPFDAAIIDLTVPGGMGGKEAIRKLLELDPHVKAIVSSGYSEDPIMSDFQQYGFSGVIAKPYRIEDMSAILHKVLRGEKV
jgi:PAS domain S-box-containing protein